MIISVVVLLINFSQVTQFTLPEHFQRSILRTENGRIMTPFCPFAHHPYPLSNFIFGVLMSFYIPQTGPFRIY